MKKYLTSSVIALCLMTSLSMASTAPFDDECRENWPPPNLKHCKINLAYFEKLKSLRFDDGAFYAEKIKIKIDYGKRLVETFDFATYQQGTHPLYRIGVADKEKESMVEEIDRFVYQLETWVHLACRLNLPTPRFEPIS